MLKRHVFLISTKPRDSPATWITVTICMASLLDPSGHFGSRPSGMNGARIRAGMENTESIHSENQQIQKYTSRRAPKDKRRGNLLSHSLLYPNAEANETLRVACLFCCL
eukprot:3899436-Amphidinium_carterae.1